MVIPALIAAIAAGCCPANGGGPAGGDHKGIPRVFISFVDISVKTSTNNLLLLGIVTKVTEADVKTSKKEDE